MSEKAILEAALKLSPAERILLVEDVWDSLAADPDAFPVSAAQRAELDARLEAHRTNPEAGSTWDEVRGRLQGRE
jgi:putative addiction module component (TIGR02574 family)